MGDHVAVAVVPSQVANPWRAAWRTFVQVLLPAVVLILTVGPEVLRIVAEQLGGVVPDGWISWLLGAAGVLAAVAGAVARIMALPGVNRWLSRLKLDAGAPSASAVIVSGPDGDVAARGSDG